MDQDDAAAEGDASARNEFVRGNLRFYGAADALIPRALVVDIPEAARTVNDAFVSAKVHTPAASGIATQGAVYYPDGRLMEDFVERREALPDRFDDPITVDRERIAQAAVVLEGSAVYLGQLSSHFGHFLLESLARAWILEFVGPDCGIVFHHAVRSFKLQPFAVRMLEALGVQEHRLVVASRDHVCRRLLVPSSQNWILFCMSTHFGRVFDKLRTALTSDITDHFPKKVYFTRRQLAQRVQASDAKSGSLRRSYANEEELERIFDRAGYEIVAPERLTLEAQIAMVSRATHIAGTTGSAMHLAIFNDRPDTRVISIDTRFSQSQLMIETVRGLQGHHIFGRGTRAADGTVMADTRFIDDVLSGIQ